MTDQRDMYFIPTIPREWGDPVAALPPARLVQRNLRRRLVWWVMVPTMILLFLWMPILTSDSPTPAGVILTAVVQLAIASAYVDMRRRIQRRMPRKAPLLVARAGYLTAEGMPPGWAFVLDNVGGQTAHYDREEIQWRFTEADKTWTDTGISGFRMDFRTQHWPCVGDGSDSRWSIPVAGSDALLYVPAEEAQRIIRLAVTVEFEDDRGDRFAHDFLLSPSEAVAGHAVAV